VNEPTEDMKERGRAWARERWGGTFDGYPVQVEAYACALADKEAEFQEIVQRELDSNEKLAALKEREGELAARLQELLVRIGPLEIMAQEAVRERNEQLYALERAQNLRRQTESKCVQLRRQLHDEKAKLAAVMDNVAEMMAQAQAWERTTEATIRKAVADGQARSIRGCADICQFIADEFDAEGDSYVAGALNRASKKILSLLETGAP
jgi:chromosome segregation ATPase